jgi:hypothetical protein
MTGGWRKLYNEELHNLYSSSNVIRVIKSRRMRWGWHVVYMGDMRNEFGLSVGNSARKGPLGRPGSTWKDNIQMDFNELECEILD